ncbi:GDSL-like lipase/acylhydrolase family protein [Curtobacterium sp. PhB136]|nr:GDSL-like lipase/acylhydrolase family protein [Curtobacterium sp. PhB136]
MIGAVVVVAAGASMVATRPPVAEATATDASRTDVRVAVVGDSLSAGRSRFLGNGLDDESWMTYANGDGIEFAGGWARSGATPDEMAAAVQPVRNVDVLVVLAGTNAVRVGRTVAQEEQAYRTIARVVGAREVIVSALPPYDWKAAEALRYNRELQRFATNSGWTWVDPWVFARSGNGWAAGVSVDGTHPAGPEQYQRLGESFRRIILEDVRTRAPFRVGR